MLFCLQLLTKRNSVIQFHTAWEEPFSAALYKPTYAAVMNEQNKPIHFPFPSSGIPWKRSGRRGRRGGRVGGAPSSGGGGEAHLDAFVLLLRVKRMRRRVIGKWEIDCVQSEVGRLGEEKEL